MGNSWSNRNATSNQNVPNGTLGPRPPQNAAQRNEINPRMLFYNSEFAWNFGENVFEGLSPYNSNALDIPPPSVVHERTVRNVVRLSKSSLQLVPSTLPKCYVLQFHFDTLVDCGILTYFLAKEFQDDHLLSFSSQCCSQPSIQYFRAGLGQTYRQGEAEALNFSKVAKESLVYRETDEYPVIVEIKCNLSNTGQAGTLGTELSSRSENSTNEEIEGYYIYLSLDKEQISSGTFPLRVIKQKIIVHGVIYELEEIYGIDSGNTATAQGCVSSTCYSEDDTCAFVPSVHKGFAFSQRPYSEDMASMEDRDQKQHKADFFVLSACLFIVALSESLHKVILG
ncbi:Probable E3 ubiquitin-protein ligase LOG2 [Galdieria sulphuraria]|nr:Probable E3 ubiquitin-protein ligase LOG2 [Galdieria sulphuraria]